MTPAALDLRGVRCPMNVVRLKLALEPLAAGEELEVVLDPGEGMENVPQAALRAGHQILSRQEAPACRIRIRKGGP